MLREILKWTFEYGDITTKYWIYDGCLLICTIIYILNIILTIYFNSINKENKSGLKIASGCISIILSPITILIASLCFIGKLYPNNINMIDNILFSLWIFIPMIWITIVYLYLKWLDSEEE